MKLRKRRPTREVSIDNNFQSEEDNRPIDVADWAPNPEGLYSAAELREILRKTLQELGPGLRMVFVLRDIEGLSLEQTAEALGLSLSAVKARSWRARLQLRERLSEYFNNPEEFAGVEPAPVTQSGQRKHLAYRYGPPASRNCGATSVRAKRRVNRARPGTTHGLTSRSGRSLVKAGMGYES